MKQYLIASCALLVMALPFLADAGIRKHQFTQNISTATITTNTFQAYGDIAQVHTDITTVNSGTGTVALTHNDATIFSMAFTADGAYCPLMATHAPDGSSNTLYRQNFPVGGLVTLKITDNMTVYTNSYTVTIYVRD